MAQGRGKVKNIYPGGNTAQGFYSLYDSALQNLRRLFILKGGPGTGKSTLIRQVGLAMVDRGYDIEFLHCSSDNRSLDGSSSTAGIRWWTARLPVWTQISGAVGDVNLGCWNGKKCARSGEYRGYTTVSWAFGQLIPC